MTLAALSLAFTLGLLSTVHCWGMCGGLLLAFSPARGARTGVGPHTLLGYNLGRVTSYTLAGALTGSAAGAVLAAVWPAGGHRGLQFLAAAVLVLSGIALLRRLPGQVWLQRLGVAGWRRLQPLTRGLLPAVRFEQRFLLGMVWGWLPCGFVYSMLALAATQGSAGAGAATMCAFGLGTLPGMLAAEIGVTRLRTQLRRIHAPALAAWLLIGSGVALLALQTPWRTDGGHQHGSPRSSLSAEQMNHADPTEHAAPVAR